MVVPRKYADEPLVRSMRMALDTGKGPGLRPRVCRRRREPLGIDTDRPSR